MSTRFGSVICLAALALVVALPGAALAADDSGAAPAPVTLSDDQIAALEDASSQGGGDQSVFSDVSDFVTDNAPYFIIGIVVLAAIIAGIFIMRGRSRSGGAGDSGPGAGQPSAAEMKRRKRAAIQRSREEERLRRKGGRETRGPAGQAVSPAAAAGAGIPAAAGAAGGPSAGVPAGIDPVAAEKQGARDQRMAAAAVARTGGAVPAPPSPSQTAPSAAVTAAGTAAAGAVAGTASGAAARSASEGSAPGRSAAANPTEPDTVVTGAAEVPQSPPQPEAATGGSGLQAGQVAAPLAAGAAGGALAGRAASSASPPDERVPEQEVDDAEARLRAKVDEIKAGQAEAGQAGTPVAPAAEDQLRRVEQLERDLGTSEPPPRSTPGLAAVERRLSADSVERDRILREAEDRLRRIEQRAEDAERRAAFAERLAHLKIEESEREQRLNDVVAGIDRAEERAREAEARAESAERAAAASLEERSTPRANLPESFSGGTSAGAASKASGPGSDRSASPPGAAPGRPESSAGAGVPAGASGGGEAGIFAPREASRPAAPPEAPEQEREETAAAATGPGVIDINRATFEDLREAELSVTQATRVLAYRERFGGYRSVDDLEKVPGFPEDLIESLRHRITV